MQAKADLFEVALADLADQARALAHPARLAILQVLAERGTCICGELVDALPLAQASVSRHLKALKEAGLIRGEIDGPRSCYCLDYEAVRALRGEMDAFFAGLPEASGGPLCC
ncbi:MAG: ArsR/SmtB family transcription factor [Rhodothermales bacterium]